MTDEQSKGQAVPQETAKAPEPPPEVAAVPTDEEFIFDLKDQPTIKIRLRDGKIKEFAADMVLLEMLHAGFGTKEVESNPESVRKICDIVESHVGEPVGPGIAGAIVHRMTGLMAQYRKKAGATSDSDTTSGSERSNTNEPAP